MKLFIREVIFVNRLTTGEFIAKMKNVYGDEYDYSEVQYVNTVTPVKIKCKTHGVFEKKPNLLLKGYGCPQCAAQKREEDMKNNEAERKADYARRAEKRKATLQARYGVSNPMELDSVKEKIKQTCLERYGVENPRQSQVVIDKARQTNLERYGAISYTKTEEGLQRIQSTMIDRFGADNFMKSQAHYAVLDRMQARSADTQLVRYGARHWSMSETARRKLSERKAKEYATKQANHSWQSSQPEQRLEEMLKSYFGEDDVRTQYSSKEYPFQCDFYIESRDMYIELNATWTHGSHWYDNFSVNDVDVLYFWEKQDSDYYKNAVETWTERDAKKRSKALVGDLNYVVFWMSDLWDAELWFAMGCPDGRDWEREYSWLPYRNLSFDGVISNNQTPKNMSMIAKKYQFDVFYEKELEMWQANDFFRGIPLQAYIYINRYHYLKKTPFELTSMEILRAFWIAGIKKGYTRFDTTLMQNVLDEYSDEINHIYDPFAGWGERMLCASANGKSYDGVDINSFLFSGYKRMIADFDLTTVKCLDGDSCDIFMPSYCDTVITCPPYYDTEIYTKYGIESCESYMSFLERWSMVVDMCSDAKLFCFQVNQKYKDDMRSMVEFSGFNFERSFVFSTNKASHFNRKNGENNKKEYEEMLVFRHR